MCIRDRSWTGSQPPNARSWPCSTSNYPGTSKPTRRPTVRKTGLAVLMGVSAARLHNVVPRALGMAIVAVPGDRRDIVLRDRDGLVHFVERDTDVLDAELMTTDLGQCLVTRAARGLNQLPSSSTGVGETVPPSTGERRGL